MNATLTRVVRGTLNAGRIGELFRCIATSRQWWDLIQAYVVRKRLSYPFEFKTRSGCSLVLNDWDELTTVWHVFFANEYYVPSDARVIVDLGANIGAFAVWAAERRLDSRIFSVEPFPSTFDRLCFHVNLNGLQDRVQIVQAAIAGHDGTGMFDAREEGRSYCRKLISRESGANRLEVACLTLATLFDRLGLDEIDCLKIDVEGAEYEILDSASNAALRRAKVITLEFHEVKHSSALWARLDRAGFRRIRFKRGGWSGLATYERMPLLNQADAPDPARHS